MLNKYAVLGYVKSNLNYIGYDKLFLKDNENKTIEVRINNFDSEISNDVKNNMDIQVTAILDASNPLEAIIKAQFIADKVVNFIAFSSSGRIEKCVFFKSISYNEEKDIKDFCQLDFEILNNISKKSVNVENFLKMLKKFQDTNYDKERIERAILFYQKGLASKDILEKFSNYWIALECLTPILNNLYPEIIEKRKCKNCGYEEEFKSTISLKKFLDEKLNCKHIYSKCRKIRISIVHGLKNIDEIEKDAYEVLEELEKCTYSTIIELLGLNIKKEYDVSDEEEGLTFESHLQIVNYNIFKKEKIVFPNITISMMIDSIDDVLILKPTLKVPILNEGAQIKGLGWDYYGTCGQDIQKIQLVITN